MRKERGRVLIWSHTQDYNLVILLNVSGQMKPKVRNISSNQNNFEVWEFIRRLQISYMSIKSVLFSWASVICIRLVSLSNACQNSNCLGAEIAQNYACYKRNRDTFGTIDFYCLSFWIKLYFKLAKILGAGNVLQTWK